MDNQPPPTTNPIENPVPQAGTPPSPRSFLSKKTIFATFFVLIIFTLIFVIPFPSWYLGGTACMPCQDKNNCPPCPSQQWIFEKPIFWSIILPLLKGTTVNSTVQVNTSQLTSSPTPTVDKTANWKTYKKSTTKYNYSLNYPQDWTYKEIDSATSFFPPSETNENKGIKVVVINYEETPPLPVNIEYTTIRTVKTEMGNLEVQKPKPGTGYIAKTTKGDYTVEFRAAYLDPKYDDIFDQILSTFKFTQ